MLLLIAAVGCGDDDGVDCSDLVPTPGGLVPSACVHEVPDNATVEEESDGTRVVRSADGKVRRYPPCPCGPRDSSLP
ncbi:MAG: hypothetical protein ABW352_08935 [Polyangiales bacterium]